MMGSLRSGSEKLATASIVIPLSITLPPFPGQLKHAPEIICMVFPSPRRRIKYEDPVLDKRLLESLSNSDTLLVGGSVSAKGGNSQTVYRGLVHSQALSEECMHTLTFTLQGVIRLRKECQRGLQELQNTLGSTGEYLSSRVVRMHIHHKESQRSVTTYQHVFVAEISRKESLQHSDYLDGQHDGGISTEGAEQVLNQLCTYPSQRKDTDSRVCHDMRAFRGRAQDAQKGRRRCCCEKSSLTKLSFFRRKALMVAKQELVNIFSIRLYRLHCHS